jgi:hypothetical protein
MSELKEVKIEVVTTGSDGSAEGDTDSDIVIRGELVGFRVNYHASAPATTDTVITAVLPTGYPTQTLLTLTNTNTDIPYRPVQEPVYTTANALSDPDQYDKIPLMSKVNVDVSGTNALDPCVTVWVIYKG